MLGDSRAEKGSITLVTLCFAAVLALALGSFLALCRSSYSYSTRQLHETKVRELAQAGLEEALWALNQDIWTSSGSASSQSWTTSGANRTISLNYPGLGQGATGQVTLTVANYAGAGPTWPTITSAATITLDDGRTFIKTLQGALGPAPLFGNAIASANSYVSFVTGGLVDSWNSDPDNNPATAAVAYAFNAADPHCYAAVVAGNDDGTYGVVLNQAQVNGYVTTFGKPISYSTSGSPNGMVKGPLTPAAVKVDPARIGQSAFIPASSVFAFAALPTSGPNYGGLLGSVLALVGSLLGAPSTAEVYRVNGDLTILGILLLSPNLTVDNRAMKLIVDGNLTISGAGKITINPNASLEIFVAGDVAIGGNGIDNQTHDPKKCAIFCTGGSTVDSVQYTSSADFYGVIYSENKPIDIRQNADFYGALLSGQYVRFSTSATAPQFHYDTSLRNARFSYVTTPYVINQLTEL
ncbi:MAG: hypothetical protein JWM88_1280 [Verrucomicrobia bacterium]|nr:hypothetical protein [Verrucomicrobiota bacterium]